MEVASCSVLLSAEKALCIFKIFKSTVSKMNSNIYYCPKFFVSNIVSALTMSDCIVTARASGKRHTFQQKNIFKATKNLSVIHNATEPVIHVLVHL